MSSMFPTLELYKGDTFIAHLRFDFLESFELCYVRCTPFFTRVDSDTIYLFLPPYASDVLEPGKYETVLDIHADNHKKSYAVKYKVVG